MKGVALSLLTLLLGCYATSTPAQSDSHAAASCYKETSHADARSCLEQYSQRTLAALSAVEVSVRSGLSSSVDDATERARELSAFDEAAARFAEYRDRQCAFVASLAAGGNSATDRRLLCEIELNNARAMELARDLRMRSN
jgi:uncharacterized protein YecT (DUF1311 family)